MFAALPVLRSRESRITALVGLIGLAILLAARSDDPAILGRYSLRYVAVVVAYAVSMAGAVALTSLRFPSQPVSRFIVPILPLLVVISFAAVSALTLLDHTWPLNVTLKLSYGWVLLAMIMRSRARIGLWAAVTFGAALLALNALTIVSYPQIHATDEGWTANFSLTFYQDGQYYARINQGIYGNPQRYIPLANVLPAHWFALVGVGLFQARAMMFFASALLLAFTYAAARRLYQDRAVALYAALFLAASFAYLQGAHRFRFDVYLGLAGVAAAYLFLRSESRPMLAFFSGLLLALAAELHQNALLLCAASALFLTSWIARRSLARRQLSIRRRDVYFALGGLLGGAVYLGIHVLPDAAEYARQFGNMLNPRLNGPPGMAESPGALYETIWRFLDYLRFSPFEAVSALLAALVALRERRMRPLALLLILVIALIRPVTSPDVLVNYVLHFWPLMAMIVAGVLREQIEQRSAVVFALLVAVAMPAALDAIRHDRAAFNTRLMQVARQIAPTLRPEEKVVTLHYMVFVLPEYKRLIVPFMHDYAVLAGSPLRGEAIWETLAPDVFIVSPVLGEPTDTPATRYRERMGFAEVARYDGAGCCVIIYRSLLADKQRIAQ